MRPFVFAGDAPEPLMSGAAIAAKNAKVHEEFLEPGGAARHRIPCDVHPCGDAVGHGQLPASSPAQPPLNRGTRCRGQAT